MRMVEIGKKDTESTEQMGKLSEVVISSPQLPAAASASDEWLLATHGRTFHFAARFLSPKHRHQVVTLYAFFRTLDDLVDQPAASSRIEDIHIELRAWKSWFTLLPSCSPLASLLLPSCSPLAPLARKQCPQAMPTSNAHKQCPQAMPTNKGRHSFPAPREPLGAKLAAVLAEHPIPNAIFLDFLDGMVSDLEPREIRDFSEMHHYCYRVAGTVGLAMAHILGIKSAQALVAAQNLGIGMQLTNILRDVGSDLAAGRIYLPEEDLERFGSSRTHLFQLLKDQRGPDDRFRALMRYQVARAHRYYVRGMSGIWLLPPDCRLPILLAGRLYRRILTAIEHKDYDVLRSRAATNFPEKVQEAAIAFTLDRLWRRGEALPRIEAEVLFED